jgi:hypothetical protein
MLRTSPPPAGCACGPHERARARPAPACARRRRRIRVRGAGGRGARSPQTAGAARQRVPPRTWASACRRLARRAARALGAFGAALALAEERRDAALFRPFPRPGRWRALCERLRGGNCPPVRAPSAWRSPSSAPRAAARLALPGECERDSPLAARGQPEIAARGPPCWPAPVAGRAPDAACGPLMRRSQGSHVLACAARRQPRPRAARGPGRVGRGLGARRAAEPALGAGLDQPVLGNVAPGERLRCCHLGQWARVRRADGRRLDRGQLLVRDAPPPRASWARAEPSACARSCGGRAGRRPAPALDADARAGAERRPSWSRRAANDAPLRGALAEWIAGR